MARKKKKGDDIKTDGWMDTYADTITLLLTFFILLYSISSVDSEKLKQLSQALQNSLTGTTSVEELKDINDLKVNTKNDGQDENKNQNQNQGQGQSKYEDLAGKLNNIIEKNNLSDKIKIRKEDRGIVLQVDESILFDSGSANIKPSSIHVLNTISKIIKETDNEIVAEGNTDNVPIKDGEYDSNWELSTERALSIVKYLIKNENINPNRISLKGYGEYNPIVPNDNDADRAKNRRVDILVVEQRDKSDSNTDSKTPKAETQNQKSTKKTNKNDKKSKNTEDKANK